MKIINCTEEMVKIAISCKENFTPSLIQPDEILNGVGFNDEGEKVIEFVDYTDENGYSQSTYYGSLTDYANRVVLFEHF